jgi:hypothetical protein
MELAKEVERLIKAIVSIHPEVRADNPKEMELYAAMHEAQRTMVAIKDEEKERKEKMVLCEKCRNDWLRTFSR